MNIKYVTDKWMGFNILIRRTSASITKDGMFIGVVFVGKGIGRNHLNAKAVNYINSLLGL